MQKLVRKIVQTFISIFIFAFLLVLFIVGVLRINSDCDDFHDLEGSVTNECINVGTDQNSEISTICTTTENFILESIISFEDRLNIQKESTIIGFYLTESAKIRETYSYIHVDPDDGEEINMGTIEEKGILGVPKYVFSRCDEQTLYTYEKNIITLDDPSYKLFKNNTLLGSTSLDGISSVCKPNIILTDPNDNVIATFVFDCDSEALFRDKWRTSIKIEESSYYYDSNKSNDSHSDNSSSSNPILLSSENFTNDIELWVIHFICFIHSFLDVP